jgi:hypothetical protein
MQKPVLEHTPTEAQSQEVAGEVSGAKSGISRISYVYEEETKLLENPDEIEGLSITLPNGKTARFARINNWR